MPVNTSFTPNQTLKEQEDCLQWFEANMDRLPSQISMPGVSVPDLKDTARRMVRHLRICKENKTYFGQFALLMHLRRMVEDEWKSQQQNTD